MVGYSRRIGMVAVAVMAALVLPAPAAFSAGDPSPGAVPGAGGKHRSGLRTLGERAVPAPLPEEVSDSLGRAERLAQESPRNFGYAWVDRATGQVMLDVATEKGARLAGELRQALVEKPARQRPKVRRVGRSQQELERVKHEVIELDGVWASEVDPQTGRVAVTVKDLTDALAGEITRRYGTEQVAVRVEPGYRPPTSSSRTYDVSPFWGGARINVPGGGWCTSGFAWQSPGASVPKYYMLTAGHCVPDGGTVYASSGTLMGSVTSRSRENWDFGVGTQYLTGQSVYRGDLALIEIPSGKSSFGKIYRGGPTARATEAVAVTGMLARAVAPGDSFCTGGARTGEICGWTVAAVGRNLKIDDGADTWAVLRNAVTSSFKTTGKCMAQGDSGGPVYLVRSDGKVTAIGIINAERGGDTATSSNPCRVDFTDIRQAYYGFPGTIKTG